MRFEQLQYFLEIVKDHSISIASENLYITQPALSRMIKNLENELGVELLSRSVEGVVLTEEGKALKPEIESIVALTMQLKRHALKLSKQTDNEDPHFKTFKILTFSTLVDALFFEVVPLFQNKYPHIHLFIDTLTIRSFSDNIDWQNYDLVILIDINNLLNISLLPEKTMKKLLFSEQYFMVMHKDVCSETQGNLENILQQQIIVYQNRLPIEELFLHLFEKKIVRSVIQCNNTEVVRNLLLQKNTVLFIGDLLKKQYYQEERELCIIPLKNVYGKCIALYNIENIKVNIIEDFLNSVKSTIGF